MSRTGIVNVRMVITEEKILSNIDKVQKLINPNSKKQIVELEEDSYFKDLVESIKTYFIEYPKKNNFPRSVYKATYGLVEFATMQFEENTKKIEELIKKREENIALSGELKEATEAADENKKDWKEKIQKISDKVEDDILDSLILIGNSKDIESQEYIDAKKFLKARINNLEANLHIEIDMERLEDSSKALSYIGIEVADALRLIPAPEEQIEAVAEKNAIEEQEKIAQKVNEINVKSEIIVPVSKKSRAIQNFEAENNESKVEAKAETSKVKFTRKSKRMESINMAKEAQKDEYVPSNISAINEVKENLAEVENAIENNIVDEKKEYVEATTFEAKPSLWQRFKNSKFVQAATYIFRIKIRIELPANALPEGRGEN